MSTIKVHDLAIERVVTVRNAIFGVLWAVGSLLYFMEFSHGPYTQAPFMLSAILFVLGTAVWTTIRLLSLRKQFRAIERKGVSEPSSLMSRHPQMWLAVLFALAGAIILVMFIAVYMAFWLNFFFPVFPTFYLTTDAYGWLWQHRNKRTLYTAEGKMYPYPYICNPTLA